MSLLLERRGRHGAAQPWRSYPVTVTVTACTALVGGAQFLFPVVLEALRRDPAALHGQWWRLATPLLVQSDGLGQYVFNLTGSAVVGVAVEHRYRGARWLTIYLTAGLAGQAMAYISHPAGTGAGSL